MWTKQALSEAENRLLMPTSAARLVVWLTEPLLRLHQSGIEFEKAMMEKHSHCGSADSADE